ncbi:MAG: carbamate kinase [Deltaproteobacteria bacterium]|nr:carbamate kinase [Deltaproteobacteria bacterium]
MTKPVAVVAFGGNAILSSNEDMSFETQLNNAKETCRQMLGILRKRYEMVIVHGNGPQVGNLLIQFESARDIIPIPPLDAAVASSQGLLGHMLLISMRTMLEEECLQKEVTAILTQVVVDEEDPAYLEPTKPIGPFYSRERAEVLKKEKGWHMVEDSNRGYRRVVFSPRPRKIMALNVIRRLIESGTVVIACGGGGIPVNHKTDKVIGTEGVIDKDFTAALLAYNLNAELFLILTAVNKVCVNYGKPDQYEVDVMSVAEAKAWLKEGHFPPGSMGPKIEAAIEFVERGGKEAIITGEKNLLAALNHGVCTRIIGEYP